MDKAWGRNKHFSFLINKSKIIAVGWNQYSSHPIAAKYGYWEDKLHSEVHCILKGLKLVSLEKLSKLILVNIQLYKGQRIKISRPCEHCQIFLADYPVKIVYYSLDGGGWGNFLPVPNERLSNAVYL